VKVVLMTGLAATRKSSTCQNIKKALPDRVNVISVGRILREKAKADKALSQTVEAGKKVSDRVILDLILSEFAVNSTNIVDNFPQSITSLKVFVRRLGRMFGSNPELKILTMLRDQDLGDRTERSDFLINRNIDYRNTIQPMLDYMIKAGVEQMDVVEVNVDVLAFLLNDSWVHFGAN